MPYDQASQYHLTASWAAMQMQGASDGLVLDLGSFTDPPSPYQVWHASPLEVVNANETKMLGRLAIAGFSKELWELPQHQLPINAKHGKVVAGFYQIRRDQVGVLEEFIRYLADSQSKPNPLREMVRRRVAILIEIERPKFLFGNPDRFRKKRVSAAPVVLAAVENDAVPPGEAVFQWWWGDADKFSWGHWKNYHPHVSAKLERALADSERFRTCLESVPIDDVRYSLQRISRERPFDFLDKNLTSNFREPFMPEHVITVNHSTFDDAVRLMSNCFVQFQNGNPKRRRPVRRIRRGEAAGIEMPSGEPCGICFSDTGVLTGCEKGHVMCHSCLRFGLRTLLGDISQSEGLMCGCLSYKDNCALDGLAEKADVTWQERISRPPVEANERAEFDIEIAMVRRSFQISEQIPLDAYRKKLREWFDLLNRKMREHLYHVCDHPGCRMENWILREDFDRNFKSKGLYNWTCKQGHKNSVLPSQADINEMNKNILMHPEIYADRCSHDDTALRRFRLCALCIKEGSLTFAVHESGCKQWPGGGATATGHKHCFCFRCTRVWGAGGCDHNQKCADPGIQQVRRITGGDGMAVLEQGFIPGQAYIDWVKGTSTACPDTTFPSGKVLGATRQGILGMEDRAVLRQAMEQGTT